MKKYRFRLEAVHRVRSAKRNELREALADAYRASETLSEQMVLINDQLQQLRRQQREATHSPALDLNYLVAAQRYELVLNVQRQAIAEKIALVEKEAERRRLRLVEAEQEVRALELLDKRQHALHQRQARLLETKQMDEIASQRSNR